MTPSNVRDNWGPRRTGLWKHRGDDHDPPFLWYWRGFAFVLGYDRNNTGSVSEDTVPLGSPNTHERTHGTDVDRCGVIPVYEMIKFTTKDFSRNGGIRFLTYIPVFSEKSHRLTIRVK